MTLNVSAQFKQKSGKVKQDNNVQEVNRKYTVGYPVFSSIMFILLEHVLKINEILFLFPCKRVIEMLRGGYRI